MSSNSSFSPRGYSASPVYDSSSTHEWNPYHDQLPPIGGDNHPGNSYPHGNPYPRPMNGGNNPGNSYPLPIIGGSNNPYRDEDEENPHTSHWTPKPAPTPTQCTNSASGGHVHVPPLVPENQYMPANSGVQTEKRRKVSDFYVWFGLVAIVSFIIFLVLLVKSNDLDTKIKNSEGINGTRIGYNETTYIYPSVTPSSTLSDDETKYSQMRTTMWVFLIISCLTGILTVIGLCRKNE